MGNKLVRSSFIIKGKTTSKKSMAQIGDELSKFVLSAEIQQFTLWTASAFTQAHFPARAPFEVQLSSGLSMSCVALPSLQSTPGTEQCVLCCCRMWIYHRHSSACSDTAQSRAAGLAQALNHWQTSLPYKLVLFHQIAVPAFFKSIYIGYKM